MHKKYANEDLIDIVGINTDFLKQFSPYISRSQVIEEIKQTFDDLSGRKNLVLDVKGVVPDEESYIKPKRPYTQNAK